MNLNFTLIDNITATSVTDGLSVVHKLKNPNILRISSLEQIGMMERLWAIDKKKNLQNFVAKLLDTFQAEDEFLILIPPTHRNQFTAPLKEFILDAFPNAIDVSTFFHKKQGVSFGTPPYSNMKLNELIQFINVDEEFNNHANINRILIADDVYSQGKTMNVLEIIIQERIANAEIIGATLIRTR
jgi:hypothetical protein